MSKALETNLKTFNEETKNEKNPDRHGSGRYHFERCSLLFGQLVERNVGSYAQRAKRC